MSNQTMRKQARVSDPDAQTREFKFKVEEPYRLIAFTVKADSDAPEELARMMAYIKRTADIGHSFDIVVDPDTPDYKQSFGMDGDGSDHIIDLWLDGKKVEWKGGADGEMKGETKPWYAKKAADVGTYSKTLWVIDPEQLSNLLKSPWFTGGVVYDLDHEEKREALEQFWCQFGGGVFHTGKSGVFDVKVMPAPDGTLPNIREFGLLYPYGSSDFDATRLVHNRENLHRTAAQVGTDSASVWSIDPIQLAHLVKNPKFLKALDDLGGGGLDTAEKLWRQHGGAWFHTGADGTWDVKIPVKKGDLPIPDEKGFTKPYGTAGYDPEKLRASSLRIARRWVGVKAGAITNDFTQLPGVGTTVTKMEPSEDMEVATLETSDGASVVLHLYDPAKWP